MRLVFVLILIQLVLSAKNPQNFGFKKIQEAAKNAIQCKPYGVRLNLGRSIMDLSSNEKLGVRFNTAQKCQNVNLLINDKIVTCPVRPTSNFTMQNGQKLVSYIHQCSLKHQIEYNKVLNYNIIDQDTLKTYFTNDISITISDPATIRPVNFIHLADWAKITYKINQFPSITAPIKQILAQEKIDAVIINGDIAYQIHTNITHHMEFMEMLEQISKLTPTIFNRGNHEYEHAAPFFCEYFQVYDLCSRNATSLQVGSAFLSLFDPQAALIPRKFSQYTQSQRHSSRQNLENDLKKGKQSGRVIIALSHYPMVCSYPTKEHCVPDLLYKQFLPLYVNLQQHYNTLLDYRVPLILSGHVHTYQRTHPLIRGYKYKLSANPKSYDYKNDQEATLIQVTEGVAGSDADLFQNYTYQGVQHKVQPFIAKHNLNQVGFGLLKVDKSKINYEHFGVNLDGSLVTIDDFTISFTDKEKIIVEQASNQKDQL